MADERIDIEIVDKVSPAVKTKLDGIATSARSAFSALEQLQGALAKVNANPLNKLLAAEGKLANSNAKLAAETAKAATAQQRLATEVQRTTAAESRAEIAAVRLKNAQEKASQSAKNSGFSFSAMKGQIFGVVAALGSLWAAFKLADDFANLENRLRSTGLEGAGLDLVMQKLEDSANNTRSSLVGTVELYSRLAVSSKELGVSQNDLIGFTTSLNQAILLSGANANEAQAGLIQLSQGMASGTLRGDELRSVLEQLPAVADVIAKSLGVTRGELRALGTDGKITAQTILKAFKEAGPELGERFAGQVTTGSQALGVLHNKVMEIAGEEGKGSLNQVAKAIMDVGAALEEARPIIGVFLKGIESTVKILRVIMLGAQAFFSGVIPILFAEAGRQVAFFSSQLLDVFYNIAKVGSVVLPDSWGKGLTEMIDGLRNASGDATKYFNEMQTNAVDRLGKISETMADIYRPDVAQAGMIPDLDKKSAAKPTGLQGFENVANAFKIKYESWFENDIVDAFSQINDELDRMEATLGKSKIDVKMLDIAKAMEKTKGFGIEETGIRKRLEAIEAQNNALARQAAILDSIKRTDFNTAMSDLQTLGASGQLSTTGRQDYLIAQNPDLFEGTQEALDANVRAYADMYARIGILRQNNDVSEATASQMRTKVWVLENETRFQNTSTILGNLATLQQSTNRTMGRVGKAFAVSQATIDGVLAVQKALASAPPPWNYALAASVGVAAGVNVAKIQGLPGFEVGGYTGNVAKNQIAGVVHGNEYVMDSASVNRLGVGNLDALRSGAASVQQNYTTNNNAAPAGASNGQSAGNAPSQQGGVRIVNLIDPAMFADYMQSPEGEAIFLNTIRNNSDTVKSVVNM